MTKRLENQNVLTHLGLSPEQTTHLTGRQRTRLISFLLRWEQNEAALACLDELIPFNPTLVSLRDAQARAFLGLGQPEAALEAMQARHQIKTSLTSRALEARVHLASQPPKGSEPSGGPEAALRIAYDLVSEHPESVTAWGLLGEVHLARDDHDAALAAYRRLAELNPNSRSYLLGMLAFHQARGDHVTASGYAVRLQRSADEGQTLPATTLRRLRDYYRASGEINRADDVQAALATLYETELVELQAALADELQDRERQLERPTPRAEAPTEPPAEPLPTLEIIPVSDQERRYLEETVQKHFGFQRLLPGQAETMAVALRGQDVLTILPTGGGKSLCYQLPALLDERGTTLVISPLIALMKDQVDSLPPPARRQATTINSSLEGDELQRRMRRMAAGHFRLVYAAPERLRQPPFLHALRRAGVNRLVIDEAHCVSVWGHDFRPDYLHIARARQALGNPPLLAMTATAPPRVRRDVLQRLGDSTGDAGEGIAVVATDVYRPNLFLAAVHARNADEKLQHLLAICQVEEGSGIVYAGTRARCEQIATLLRDRGITAGYYHAGIGDRTARAAAQDAFMRGQVRVIVATVAFGMGIDKADIRFIVHLQLPPSLEAYYQEAGRAGRDGLPARCVLIYSPADRATLTRRARQDALPIEFLRAVYRAVKERLGGVTLGRVATDDLMRDLRRADDTPVRVALSMLEEAGLLRRHQDVPRTAVVRLAPTGVEPSGVEPLGGDFPAGASTPEREWAALLAAARLRPGQSLPLDLTDVAQVAGLDLTTIESQLLAWADAGWLDYRPAGRELLLELLDPPADASTRVEALIDRYATIQVQRVDEIAAYAATRRCRHGHISAYLSGRPMEACQSCDNCRPDAPEQKPTAEPLAALDLPDEGEQLGTILRCAATAPWSWGRASLVNILRGNPRAPQKGRQSPQWGNLGFRSQAAIEGLLDRLIGAEMLRPRQLGHGGVVLDLTPAGRAALEDPTRLAPLVVEPAVPPEAPEKPERSDEEIGPVDEALLERLRAWRRETARTAGVPPYVVAHDALLRHIAAIQPQDEPQLLAIKGMGPKKLSQYGAAILALLRENGDLPD